MTNEREELMLVIAAATAPQAKTVLDIDDEGAIVVDAKKLADAIIASGYQKMDSLLTHIGDTEWGVGWGEEVRAVSSAEKAKFIARNMGTGLYARSPMGKWVEVV